MSALCPRGWVAQSVEQRPPTHSAFNRRRSLRFWKRMLAYVAGSVDEELLARNEYLLRENRILRNHAFPGTNLSWIRLAERASRV